MAIDPTSSIASASLKLEDLLRVLLTELTHQNPLKPVENKDFMAQIAQFASLDASQQLNQNIQDLLLVQAIDQSVGLIDREVTVQLDSREVSGTVTAVTLSNGVPRLTVTEDQTGTRHVDISIGQLLLVRR